MPWWVWLIPIAAEVALLLPLVLERLRNRLKAIGHHTTASVALVSVVSLANALLLLALLASLAVLDRSVVMHP